MKQWEIIREAQENGAKIRKKDWIESQYVYWTDHGWISQGGIVEAVILNSSDWELYIEPIKTFGPDRAMYWLEKCFILKRKPWMKNLQIGRRINGAITFRDGSEAVDWFHNDWHLCDSEGNYVPEPEDGK